MDNAMIACLVLRLRRIQMALSLVIILKSKYFFDQEKNGANPVFYNKKDPILRQGSNLTTLGLWGLPARLGRVFADLFIHLQIRQD